MSTQRLSTVPRTTYRVQGFTSIEARLQQYDGDEPTVLIGHRFQGAFIPRAALSMDMAKSLYKQLNQLLSQ
jgi:hypothetical protein